VILKPLFSGCFHAKAPSRKEITRNCGRWVWLAGWWWEHFVEDGVLVAFEIDRLANKKHLCEGSCDYTPMALATGRATPISEEFRIKYSIYVLWADSVIRAVPRDLPCL
jgi:hypothetical protein